MAGQYRRLIRSRASAAARASLSEAASLISVQSVPEDCELRVATAIKLLGEVRGERKGSNTVSRRNLLYAVLQMSLRAISKQFEKIFGGRKCLHFRGLE